MREITLIVNVPEKILKIDGKLIRLEDSFTDASLSDNTNPSERGVDLKYKGNFSENNFPIEIEEEKLRKTYGEGLFEKLNVSGSMLEDAHYISFYGNLNPIIER